MSPFLVITLGTAGGMFIGLFIHSLWAERRAERRWREERRRIAAMHEREAAQNGRPHTDAVTRIH